eukprot:TRINITY_DN16842_c0_g1_i3.p1 TRINITY_DN16842_c0_g1~~TRINITY_DN16842_c0_g1_i3.p1  ORF type:complete len:957 (+),score=230.46 TRINITY_DN16842_c0_g1_i3:73-2943(+)
MADVAMDDVQQLVGSGSAGSEAVLTSAAAPSAGQLAGGARDADPVAPAAPEDLTRLKTLDGDLSSESERCSDAEGSESVDTDQVSNQEDQMDEDFVDIDDEFPDVDQEEVAVKDEILLLAGVEIEAEPKSAAAPDVSMASEAPSEEPSQAAVLPPPTPSGVDEEEAFSPVQSPVFHNGGTYPDQNLPPKTGIAIPMIPTSHQFIRAVPEEAELLYSAPDNLFDDIVKAEADRISKPENVRNKIVYDSVGDPAQPDSTGGLGGEDGSAAVDGARYGSLPSGPEDRTLVFESRFESGNLRRAVQAYEFEYDLILNPDYNTKSHTQWYFFRVSNTRKGPQYRFNILNMVKPTSVYNDGMRPLTYSCINAANKGVGWVRTGEKIAYYQNGLRRQKGSNYYTLTFTVSFENDCDEVYFSHCYPYTYTDLQMDLKAWDKDPNMQRRFRRRKLCETLAGNACDLITITSFCSDPAALKARRAVVITARVHPGESNASWVMKGILDYLTGASVDARILRDNFVFKIVPMLNPDGVIVGNYRCSLAGQDLNRLWDEPNRKMHPTIFFTKSMFRHLLDDREAILFVDIHGHSRKKNVFMYGNSENNGLREKIFPGLLCRSSDCFSFDDCCFKIQKSKESTARVVAYRELGVTNSFTLEASFCGADFGPLGDQHFTTRHLEEMGYMVCDAILDFCDPDQTKVQLVCKELQVLFPDDGNSDDVSDSEDDGAAALRHKRRAARKASAAVKQSKDKPPPKKKKTAAKSEAAPARPKAEADGTGDGDDDKKGTKDAREPKTARNNRRKSQRVAAAAPEDSAAAASSTAGAPEASDPDAGGDDKTAKKQKTTKKKKQVTSKRGTVTTRAKDGKKASQKAEKESAQPDGPQASGEEEDVPELDASSTAGLPQLEGLPSSVATEAYQAADVLSSIDIAASAAGITPASPEGSPASPGCYPNQADARQQPPAPYP